MATVLSTLYPPLIDTFMPAFPYDGNAEVEFSISPYNSADSINYLHISLVNQKTNQNAFEGSMRALRPEDRRRLSGTSLVNGIWIIPFQEIDNILYNDENNLWHLTIPSALLKNQDNVSNKVFTIDYYYKLQLRFDECSNVSTFDAAYLTQQRPYFSEWSSICLLKAIPKIGCSLKNFDNLEIQRANIDNGLSADENATSIPQYTSGSINLTGFLTFHNSDMSIMTSDQHGEYLKNYIIQVLNEEGELLEESPIQYTASSTDKNSFSYILDVHDQSTFPVPAVYTIKLIFTTNNNYTFTKTYQFQLIDYIFSDNFNPVWNFETRSIDNYNLSEEKIITEEDGIIKFKVNCGQMRPGYLYVRRESSIDEYKSSELIYCKGFLGGNNTEDEEEGDLQEVSCSIVDDTVSSLATYRYSVQYQTLNNRWTKLAYSQNIYVNFYDILIKRGSQQLAIRYNAQINSMTPVKTRVKIDTLGGKYPKFAENANLNYKQFTINGLITAESDFNRTFLDEFGDSEDYHLRKELQRYDDNMDGKYMIRNDTIVEPDNNNYGTYSQWILESDTYTKKRIRDLKVGKKKDSTNNRYDTNSMTRHDIYPWENWWWERYFREKVIEWLNDGEPKLWRSMTEGNMVVMFDSISLTPNAQLGRRTWNLSATVYEIGDGYKLSSLDSFGIYSITNDYKENIANGITEQIATTNYQIGQLYRVQGTTEGTTIRDLIIKKLQMDYDGLNSMYQIDPNSVILNSVKIQFHDDRERGSLPQWYDLNSWAKANENINITVYINDMPYGGSNTETITWSEILGSSVQIEDEFGHKTTLTESDILLEYLKAWETEINKGNVLVKVEHLEGDKYRDKVNKNENIATGTSVSALAENVYSLILENKRKNSYNYGLGYKLILDIVSPYSANNIIPLTRTIFVNERGYYQVPSDIDIWDLRLYDDQIATIDYLVQWDVTYNDLKDPSGFEVGEDIVGQVSGWWWAGTNISHLIYSKYYYWAISEDINSYRGVTQELEYWKATDFEVTPYSVFAIEQVDSGLGIQNIIVGRTGTLRLSSNFPIKSCILLGKRMFQTTIDRQPYLDEWEFVIDSSVYQQDNGSQAQEDNTYWYVVSREGIPYETDCLVKVYFDSDALTDEHGYTVWDVDDFRTIYDNWSQLGESFYSSADVKKPVYNTVYGVIDENGIFSYKLYYIDGGWYDVLFEDEDKTTLLARVPINGVINYKGNLIKNIYT